MNILSVLVLLQLLAVPAFTLTQPSHDYWGEFGAYGPCSRTCGTGVAMRTRKCITSRTDGGHNCIGSSNSYRTCNTHECPVGSRDFREEQCSQFDRMDFQSKRRTWVPYYGASNPCELNCVPRGENFYYRHRPAVVDGTPCYVGRTDICVDGVCRMLTHGEFRGLDADTNSVYSVAPVAVAPHPSETLTYTYKTGVYGACSATCNGGMQYRSVECWAQDPVNPRAVEETYCITQRLQRPQSQQACNMQPCAAAEYSVSSFSMLLGHRQTLSTLLYTAHRVHSHFTAAVLMATPPPPDPGIRAASNLTAFARGNAASRNQCDLDEMDGCSIIQSVEYKKSLFLRNTHQPLSLHPPVTCAPCLVMTGPVMPGWSASTMTPAASHTILLVQPTKRPEGRTYADYESVNECMEGVCKMYEEHLKRMNPNSPSITYDISQLFDFIDDLADLSCLVYRADTQTYQPYNKDWIKEKIYVLLRRQAQQAAK
ncbi:hypothetical protein F2P81_024245 [Scophthalmus maximus]|uniref:Enhancer of rudimentary homolog n=1 Tax=Scophthalmus maximus TaxID=52904 RepID=A0A6A4RTS8_SCOMX|nr:hypothetical protein F2P81_024245 [Scophthalmus maximus]